MTKSVTKTQKKCLIRKFKLDFQPLISSINKGSQADDVKTRETSNLKNYV